MCTDTDKYKTVIPSKKIFMTGFHFYEVPKHTKLINIPFGDTQCVIKNTEKSKTIINKKFRTLVTSEGAREV